MKEFISHLHFANPLFLLVLLFLPLLWRRLRERSMVVILWRSIIFLLLVLALADLQQVEEVTKKSERIFAFDLSRSIPKEMKIWMSKTGLVPETNDRTFVFGGKTKEVTDWDRWLRGEVSNDAIQPGQTNLETLFSTILNLGTAPRTVFLFTDGWETQGAVDRLLPSLTLSGSKVFPLLPPERPEVANVTVKKVLVPHRGARGEGINLRVVMENHGAREVNGRLTLKRDGKVFKNETININPGSHIFSYKANLAKGPIAAFSASFAPSAPAADVFPLDNQATSWVAVQSKEKVLLLNSRSGEDRYLVKILERRGFDVTSRTLDTLPPSPAGYGIVVFNNVEKEKFSPEYLTGIERHVAAGKAFLMVGGEGSFGPGGYRKTPIETVLPVKLKEPEKEKNRAIVIIIDKSGSMREEKRLLYAKEAAKAVLGQLKEGDLLGVVGFDITPFIVLPLAPIEEIRQDFASKIGRLKAGGKTYLYPAIVEAKRQLERQEAARKHVIILSDGKKVGGSGGDYVDLIIVMKDELKITTSAVAIGDQANIPRLRRIARYGGGLFHHTYDPTSLPRIVVEQIQKEKEQKEPEKKPQAEENYIPVPTKGSEILAGFRESSYPPLKGYNETEIRKGSQQDVMVRGQEKGSPLLASWRYGKGRSVAFTADLQGHWTKEWIQWKGLEKFWGKVFEWLRPPPKNPLPPHEVRINLLKNQPVLDLFLYGEETNGSVFRYSFTGKGTKGKGIMKRLALGHYQTSLPISAPGDYRIELLEERHGKKFPYPQLGYTLAFDPKSEIPQDRYNLSLLERLARTTAGTINPVVDELKTEEVIQTSTPLRIYLILLATALFLLEIFFRRFILSTDYP